MIGVKIKPYFHPENSILISHEVKNDDAFGVENF